MLHPYAGSCLSPCHTQNQHIPTRGNAFLTHRSCSCLQPAPGFLYCCKRRESVLWVTSCLQSQLNCAFDSCAAEAAVRFHRSCRQLSGKYIVCVCIVFCTSREVWLCVLTLLKRGSSSLSPSGKEQVLLRLIPLSRESSDMASYQNNSHGLCKLGWCCIEE